MEINCKISFSDRSITLRTTLRSRVILRQSPSTDPLAERLGIAVLRNESTHSLTITISLRPNTALRSVTIVCSKPLTSPRRSSITTVCSASTTSTAEIGIGGGCMVFEDSLTPEADPLMSRIVNQTWHGVNLLNYKGKGCRRDY